MRIPLLLCLALLASCTPRTAPADSVAATDTATTPVVGTVRVVGSAPVDIRTVLQTEDGRSLELTGPLRQELRSLSGAVVAVHGTVEGGTLEASDYEIRSVNGEPVVMGVVESVSERWTQLRTPAGELVYLGSAPQEFRIGDKVWVQGPSAVIVQTYGRIGR